VYLVCYEKSGSRYEPHVDFIEKNEIFQDLESVGESSKRHEPQMGTQLSDFIKRKKGTVVDLTGFGTGLRPPSDLRTILPPTLWT
jgi:hypothetical protein